MYAVFVDDEVGSATDVMNITGLAPDLATSMGERAAADLSGAGDGGAEGADDVHVLGGIDAGGGG